MRIAKTYSYRHAEAIIENEFPKQWAEIRDIISSVRWSRKSPPVIRKRQGKVVARLTLNQVATNTVFEQEFKKRRWRMHPAIVSASESRLVADFKKGPVQVEVQFGNMARWYTDVFKFLLSYAANDIELGVLVVPVLATAKKIDENVVNFERIKRELPHAKMAVTIPVWVIGVS